MYKMNAVFCFLPIFFVFVWDLGFLNIWHLLRGWYCLLAHSDTLDFTYLYQSLLPMNLLLLLFKLSYSYFLRKKKHTILYIYCTDISRLRHLRWLLGAMSIGTLAGDCTESGVLSSWPAPLLPLPPAAAPAAACGGAESSSEWSTP